MNKKLKALIVFAAMILILGSVAIIGSYQTEKVEYVAEVKTQDKNDDLDSIYNEADFKKMVELKARKIKAEREMEAENVRHEETIKALEADLETIRSQELDSFQ